MKRPQPALRQRVATRVKTAWERWGGWLLLLAVWVGMAAFWYCDFGYTIVRRF